MGWVVVRFLKENQIEVVPNNWITNNKKYCFWPPSGEKIEKAIKNCIDFNQDTWFMYEIKVLSKSVYDDFATANYKASKACFTSDISEAEEALLPAKRIVRKKLLTDYDEELNSDETEIDEGVTVPPPPKKPQKTYTSSGIKERHISNDMPKNFQTEQAPFRTHSRILSDDTFEHGNNNANCGSEIHSQSYFSQIEMPLKDNSSNKTFPKSNLSTGVTTRPVKNTSTTKEMIHLLVTIKNQLSLQNTLLEENKKILISISEDLNSRTKETNPESNKSEEILNMFPLNTEDELKELDTLLQDPRDLKLLAKHLARLGGFDFKDLIRRIMQKTCCDELAVKFSFKGHKGKRDFSLHKLSQVVVEAVTSKYENTVKEVECQISTWLAKAPERLKKRTEKNNNN